MLDRLAPLGRLLHQLWRGLDAARRVLLNLLLAALLLGGLAAWLASGPQRLGDKTVLVLQLNAPIVEQYPGGLRDRASKKLQGDDDGQIRLRDLLAVLDHAASNPRVGSVLLLTDDFAGAGLPSLHEVAAALQRFRASGKKLRAWGQMMDKRAYLLAAQADEILLDPMGMVYINGMGAWRNYYREALDRLGVQANVVRAGRFKSAGEVLTADGPSPETQEATAAVFHALWADYTQQVEAARKLPTGHLVRLIDELPQRLADAGGDAARLALNAKLVDRLVTPEQLRTLMLAEGASDDEGKTFRQVRLADYLPLVKPREGKAAVAVVVAEGSIVDGNAPPGQVGGRSTAELVRRAREDKDVKALVLRVNSPGGTAYGSELVRHELELTRQAGKPVVVSMGDVAASGGYWISLAADEVLADPATITGSIGVIGVMPVAKDALEKLGVHNAGMGTTWLAGAYDIRRGLDPRLKAMMQASIDHRYGDFLAKVAAARKKTPQAVDAVAQGRIWTGAQALKLGLVDRLGRLDDALQAAAGRAKLEGPWRVSYLEAGGGRLERLLGRLGVDHGAVSALVQAAAWLAPAERADSALLAALAGWGPARSVAADLQWLLQPSGPPFNALTHCLCDAP
ncbi:signal peptide peptidase SppA, 67K type [Burkholderiales bacterium JOSHI_001]|nr:signal peptide peptidase SppA, 67K type [Burkholderiales bacterium JOSHI_001]